eukprot:GHVQ01032679.1.p1 GENE.GHVQ01032679.1~~GHVQ01032679.1.p1  ORF type:complete len:248 (-),score=37.80 GHVQ01032679.1:338-1081(-)
MASTASQPLADQHLSFTKASPPESPGNHATNSTVSPSTSSPEDNAADSTLSQELPLQYGWHIWEQVVPQKDHVDYSDNTKAIASFKSVQEFWRLWNHMPQPSELLNSKRMVREADDALHLVDALMIFKEGIEPMWEDPLNARGGHFEYKLTRNVPGPQIDEYWNNLVLGMIGGNLEEGDMVTGVRLVDKLNSGRVGHGFIRIEVWFTNFEDLKKKEILKKSVETCMATHLDGTCGSLPAGDTKAHKK